MKLGKREIKVIGWMASIADAQGRDLNGLGEGDYQDWTDKDFAAALSAGQKASEASLINLALLRALIACEADLSLFYDPSEDKRSDPTMQSTGRSIAKAQKVLAQARAAEAEEKP